MTGSRLIVHTYSACVSFTTISHAYPSYLVSKGAFDIAFSTLRNGIIRVSLEENKTIHLGISKRLHVYLDVIAYSPLPLFNLSSYKRDLIRVSLEDESGKKKSNVPFEIDELAKFRSGLSKSAYAGKYLTV